jgi:hypothetical protein
MVVEFQTAEPAMSVPFGVRHLIGAVIGCLLSACAAESQLTGQNAADFCTAANGYQQGVEGAAYTNVCPDILAPAFLDGYQSGYAVHLAQLEVDAMERSIETISNELKSVCVELDAATGVRARQLSARRSNLTNELDELESEVAFRKTQLMHMRHGIAAND